MWKSMGAKSMVFPTPAFLVGTYSEDGKPNIMTAAWAGLCSSTPPCVNVCLRAATLSHGNILRTGVYSVNVAGTNLVAEADYAGMVSGRKADKFADTSLTAERAEKIDAPLVKECPMVLECKVVNQVETGIHSQFIGEILDVKVNEECLDADGQPDMAKINPLIFAPGVRKYYAVGDFLGMAFEIGKTIKT